MVDPKVNSFFSERLAVLSSLMQRSRSAQTQRSSNTIRSFKTGTKKNNSHQKEQVKMLTYPVVQVNPACVTAARKLESAVDWNFVQIYHSFVFSSFIFLN